MTPPETPTGPRPAFARSAAILHVVLVLMASALPASAVGGGSASSPGGADLEALRAAGVGAVLDRAVQAMGGREGGREAWQRVSTVEMRYEREVSQSYADQAIVATHRYTRAADGTLGLEVGIVRGEGKGSVTRIAPGEAWIEVEGQKQVLDPDQARRHVAAFAPEKLFHIPLEFGPSQGRFADDDVLSALEIASIEEVGGRPAVALRAEDDGLERLRMLVDTETWDLLEATFESAAGRITYRFAEYRNVAPGIRVPYRWEFLRNGIRLDVIRVTDLQVELGAAPPARRGDRKKKGERPRATP